MPDPAGPPDPQADEQHPQQQEALGAEDEVQLPPEAEEESPRPSGKKSAARSKPEQARQTVIVRYGLLKHIGQFPHNIDPPPAPHSRVVLRTDRGVELGEVLLQVGDEHCLGAITSQSLADYAEANGPEYPLHRGGKVLRQANPQDVIDFRHLEGSAREALTYCRQQMKELDLKMQLVAVEHLLGGERIIFYFTAEARIDFRDLVKRLAGQYRTRIEMRQVGARDEARLVGDYERCGQRCCCQQFLKDLKPVSMRMAKTQKATLDPAKISGRCGRLMCCLRYEDKCYEELRKKLPKRNTWVRTAEMVGRVIETQILTQLVRLAKPDRTQVVVANEEIIERGIEPPSVSQVSEPLAEPKPAPKKTPRRLLRDQPAQLSEEPAPVQPQAQEQVARPPTGAGEAGPPTQKKRRRRRRKKKKHRPGGGDGSNKTSQQGPSGGSQAQGGQGTQGAQSRKSRRRRRKKKPS